MKTLTQNSSNDIAIDANGQLALNKGRNAYADIVANIIRTLKGEIQLDPDAGIDYMGTVFKSITRLDIWKYYVTQQIQELGFIQGITKFDASYDSGTKILTYSLVVTTDKGVVEVLS